MHATNGNLPVLTHRVSPWISCVLTILLIPFCLAGQTDGFKYISNYDTGLWPQNWSIAQDRQGVIYVGNQNKLLVFDGGVPRRFGIPNNTIRSLAVDGTGTIYIGGLNEFGYLCFDEKGTFKYVSLKDRLDPQIRDFSTVWRINVAKEGVYFRTSSYLFRWNPDTKQIRVWKTTTRFSSSFSINGKFLVHQQNTGLMQMMGDRLTMIPGKETFARMKIFMAVPYDDTGKKWLIGTRLNGFFIHDIASHQTIPFTLEDGEFLKKNRPYYGIRLSKPVTPGQPCEFAVATLKGGLAIIDANGKTKEIFSKSYGLNDDSVKYVFQDDVGNIWLALENGVSKIEYAGGISMYDQRSNLSGIVLSVAGNQNSLYAGTTRGLFRKRMEDKRFEQFQGMPYNCFYVLRAENSILVSTNAGIFQVDEENNQTPRKIVDGTSYVLTQSTLDPRMVWAGTWDGLALLVQDSQNRWHRAFLVAQSPGGQKIKSIVEVFPSPKGIPEVWIGTWTKGVYRVAFQEALNLSVLGTTPPPTTIKHYDTSHGLPKNEVTLLYAASHLMVGTGEGLYRLDQEGKTFIPDHTLGPLYADGTRNIFRMISDQGGNIWFHSEFRNYHALPGADGNFTVTDTLFRRLPPVQVNELYRAPGENVLWLAANSGLIRYDLKRKPVAGRDFPVFIRNVSVNGKVFLDGLYDGKELPSGLDIPFKNRNIRFEFSTPCFDGTPPARYRSYLEGYDETWTQWNRETRRDYTNLDGGDYRFRVQAMDINGNVGRQTLFSFSVLPPWYRSWWAYVLYFLAAVSVIYLIVKWRIRKLNQDKRHLEQIVDARTKEVKEKNVQLEEQSERLKEMDHIKSRFFANISHEFRTPLTLIMGPLQRLLDRRDDKEIIDNISLAMDNSKRLLRLINQLLDLSSLDSGKLKLQLTRQDMFRFLEIVVGNFESLALEKEVALRIGAEKRELPLYFDVERMEQVILNLVGNAIKFTPPGGEVVIGIESCGRECVNISIRDTGIGIPEEQLPRIFDRFHQVSSHTSSDNKLKGTGIGLALVKELVELHRGTISVQSREGVGTEFVIHLNGQKDRFKPEEIVSTVSLEDTTKPVTESLKDYCPDLSKDESITGDYTNESIISEVAESGEKDVILVVEDNREMRRFIAQTLEHRYSVVQAKDGVEAGEIAKKIIPDLVVSDVMMPRLDGFQLCHNLKKAVETSHIPVILLTARASEQSLIQGLETGADDYVTKPFNQKVLLTRIKNLIDLRRGLQEKIQRDMLLHPTEIAVSSLDREFMEELKGAIEKNLKELEFGVHDLAKTLYMSRATLNRKIRAVTGESTNQFIQSYRLKRAAQLLKRNFGNITEVAFEVGFSNSSYFSRCFKEKFNCSPTSFQESNME